MDLPQDKEPRPEPERPAAGPPPLPPRPLRRAARLYRPIPPGRRLRLFILASSIGTLAAVTAIAVSMLLETPLRTSPLPVAEQFVTWLKLGEEPDESLENEQRFGYALAHDLFTAELQDSYPWIDFYQDWVRLTRQHGDIMSSKRVTWRRPIDRRGERSFAFRLRLGHPRENHRDMRGYVLEFTLARFEDEYRVTAYKLAPWDGVER